MCHALNAWREPIRPLKAYPMLMDATNVPRVDIQRKKANSTIPFCASCPLGASCEGPVTWKQVTAKYGWWRLHDASTRPPDCLNTNANQKSLQPTCAFQECFYPHACHGKPNPGQYKLKRTKADRSNELYDPAHELSNFTETCDETKGYKNNCTDKNGNVARCHLCATCIGVGDRRYKRKGSGTECQLCPSVSANRMWLGVGVVGMIFGTAVLIFLEITSETSIDETSDTVKKIILNFLQVSCCCSRILVCCKTKHMFLFLC